MCPGLAESNNQLACISAYLYLNWKTGHHVIRIKILCIIHCGGVATDGIYHNISDTDQLKCMLMDVRLSEARTH